MATADYAELEPVRRSLNIRGGDDAHDDDLIETARLAAAKAIDKLCNRPTGFAPDTAATTRVYRGPGPILFIDDVCSLEDFAVEGYQSIGVWDAVVGIDTAAQLEPFNALLDGWPYERLTGYYWPGLVRVTARWGWPEVPPEIVQATQLLVQRLFSRKDSPAGVAGWDAMGSAVRVGRADPDVQMLIGPFVKPNQP